MINDITLTDRQALAVTQLTFNSSKLVGLLSTNRSDTFIVKDAAYLASLPLIRDELDTLYRAMNDLRMLNTGGPWSVLVESLKSKTVSVFSHISIQFSANYKPEDDHSRMTNMERWVKNLQGDTTLESLAGQLSSIRYLWAFLIETKEFKPAAYRQAIGFYRQLSYREAMFKTATGPVDSKHAAPLLMHAIDTVTCLNVIHSLLTHLKNDGAFKSPSTELEVEKLLGTLRLTSDYMKGDANYMYFM